ncbi:MAG: HK97 gp10 family phage protein [Acidimicrobiales bacterium]
MADIFVTGIPELRAAFDRMVVRASAASREATLTAAHLIESRAKALAPVRQGTLRRSISVKGPRPVGATGWEAEVGPTVIYGRRRELGFHGADRLGRHYNDPGRPYLGPAFRETAAELSAIYAAAWAKAVSRV